MSGQKAVDTERTVVTTYVPAYQKTTWEEHAEDLDMSLSEFVRTMVQAGRRGFGGAADDTDSEEPHLETATPGVDVQKRVVSTLEREGPLTGPDIVEEILESLNEDIVETVEELKAEGRIERPGISNEFELVEE
mgnify:CR=1 FL=1